jgi:hypothetical protein
MGNEVAVIVLGDEYDDALREAIRAVLVTVVPLKLINLGGWAGLKKSSVRSSRLVVQ